MPMKCCDALLFALLLLLITAGYILEALWC